MPSLQFNENEPAILISLFYLITSYYTTSNDVFLSIQSKHDVLHVYLTSYTRLETKAQKIVEVLVRVMLIKEHTITCISVINYSYNFNFFHFAQ